jgi:hypothetical protein
MLKVGGKPIELAIVITAVNAEPGFVYVPSGMGINRNKDYTSRKQQSKGFHAQKFLIKFTV